MNSPNEAPPQTDKLKNHKLRCFIINYSLAIDNWQLKKRSLQTASPLGGLIVNNQLIIVN
jgi:hypothetical protein